MVTNYSNWMWENFKILKDKKLKHLCLPGNHNSATSKLQKIITDERGNNWYYELLKVTNNNLDPTVWAVIMGLSITTNRDIDKQLADGLRAFDLRVYPYNNKFYSVHQVLGIDYETIFKHISNFLNTKKGEILYLHFEFMNKDTTSDIRKKFANVIEEKLGKYAILESSIDDNPFECEYSSLIGFSETSDTIPNSRIIIHFDGDGVPTDRKIFFSNDKLKIITVNLGSSNVEEAKEKCLNDFIRSQQVMPTAPFSAQLIHTPTKEGKDIIIGAAVKDALDGWTIVTNPILGIFKWIIKKIIFKKNPPILKKIAAPFNSNLINLLNIFTTEDKINAISIAFIDYYEDGHLVDEAIKRSCSYPPSPR